MSEKRTENRRQIERRAPKRAVTIRYEDKDGYKPKRIKRAANELKQPCTTEKVK